MWIPDDCFCRVASNLNMGRQPQPDNHHGLMTTCFILTDGGQQDHCHTAYWVANLLSRGIPCWMGGQLKHQNGVCDHGFDLRTPSRQRAGLRHLILFPEDEAGNRSGSRRLPLTSTTMADFSHQPAAHRTSEVTMATMSRRKAWSWQQKSSSG